MGCWHSLGLFAQRFIWQRECRTNQITVLVWHWVDPSFGQWADYPGWEWERLNSELHPNEYIMSPHSLSTPQWNKGMRSTSALMRWWNSTSLFYHKARLMAMQMTFWNKETVAETEWYLWECETSAATNSGGKTKKDEDAWTLLDCLSLKHVTNVWEGRFSAKYRTQKDRIKISLS